ncbi:hypothetical protein [Paenibacillus alkalitolerans]|uniref:hypothetical protein n=1 Tax=Paenibacillus alkalitolerans TaxID=2799335 RepID=UPI0018F7A584|nr:hypothetical protein [Paenibacillus alkalitolerans]
MEKKRYYVSVQARTIMQNKGDSAYELEIEATPEQVEYLHELFHAVEEEDNDTYIRLHNPATVYAEDDVLEPFDKYMKEVYQMLYDLGTQETKKHIKSMNILDSL